MRISVSSSDELIRLDNFLSSRLIQFSRSKIQKLILNGNITVNNKSAKKTIMELNSICSKNRLNYPSNIYEFTKLISK